MVANRGEIAIRIFSACKELGIRCVAIYSKEDETALFRTRADESYLISGSGPIQTYLNIEKIIDIAKRKKCDAIHPGYGFLSESAEFAKACKQAGIVFIGPDAQVIDKLGDKVNSKLIANEVGVRTIKGTIKALTSVIEAKTIARECGYPVMIKASAGGGGRGMRIVRNDTEFENLFTQAQSEAKKAFGSDEMFIEQYLENPKHIEVQIIGDKQGNIVHLYERDCSIQRRHQKLIEFTPAFSLTEEQRKNICEDAIKIAKAVEYTCAGTVEFLLDKNGNHYFIEVNPRVQVEHTITELVTGIDIVQSQILIAQGYSIKSDEIGISSQESITQRGYAIQCRITTEDPMNGFMPDTGRIETYRTSSGFGIRLDGGNGFTGSIITPYYDSLLVKVTSHSRSFKDAIAKAKRALKEVKVSGVKTNIDFILNVLSTKEFLTGDCDTGFIGANNHLFDIKPSKDITTKILNHVASKIVNDEKRIDKVFEQISVDKLEKPDNLSGTRDILKNEGIDGLISWIKNQNKVLITDTTMRDAHQSLFATRMRTKDMLRIADNLSVLGKDLFSLELWGGATFDVSYRFLNEDPWDRLEKLRKKIPNVLFQMLIRGNNVVGYKNYPDNVVKKFIHEAAKSGVDIFRAFDCLNWMEGLEYAIKCVIDEGKIAEGAICYTGNILDKNSRYGIDYYIKKAIELEKMGCHILGIKDMSGLLKPFAAYKLITELKKNISIPIHLHTHDSTGNAVASCIMAAQAGVDIIDTAYNSMSGQTSQPSMNAVVAALQDTDRDTKLSMKDIEEISKYWEKIRPIYANFESELKTGNSEIYRYEIPGGQYSNFKSQVENFGLSHKFDEVKEMYREVNIMFGDIVKVTPTSKVVGDMAIFMVQNGLNSQNILTKGKNLNYPDSVKMYFSGMMGQPDVGFPKELQEIVLKGEKPITVRPGKLLNDEDFEYVKRKLIDMGIKPSDKDIISYVLYPKVFTQYIKDIKEKGNLSFLNSDVFFHGMKLGEIYHVDIKDGRTSVIKFINMSEIDEKGNRILTFEINGFRREIKIKDNTVSNGIIDEALIMAEKDNINHIGSNIPGKIVEIFVKKGDRIVKGQRLMLIEAMKMETEILSTMNGVVENILVNRDDIVCTGQLLLRIE